MYRKWPEKHLIYGKDIKIILIALVFFVLFVLFLPRYL